MYIQEAIKNVENSLAYYEQIQSKEDIVNALYLKKKLEEYTEK